MPRFQHEWRRTVKGQAGVICGRPVCLIESLVAMLTAREVRTVRIFDLVASTSFRTIREFGKSSAKLADQKKFVLNLGRQTAISFKTTQLGSCRVVG